MKDQNKPQQKINIELRPSRYFFTLISGMHLIVIFVVCVSNLPWLVSAFLFVMIILSYIYLIRKYVYRKSKYIVIKLWQNQQVLNPNIWQIQFTDKKIKDAELKPKGYISDYFIIMYFRIETDNKLLIKLSNIRIFKNFRYRNIPVIIFPDMLDYSYYIAIKRFLLGY